MPPQDPLIASSSSQDSSGKNVTKLDYYSISTTMEQVDQSVPIPRPSVLRRESFLLQFAAGRGPPQIIVMVILYAFGLGATVGIVPNLMSTRFARLNHGFDDAEGDCSSFALLSKPAECIAGSGDARNASAVSSLISNTFTLLMSSLMGSISDIHGRRGENGVTHSQRGENDLGC
jgi:hypothetical protein